MIERQGNRYSLWGKVDRQAVLLYVALCLIGFIAVFSASWNGGNLANPWAASNRYVQQIVWICISWTVALVILLTDRSIWHRYAMVFYIVGIALLLFTLAAGRTVNGAKAWIDLGVMRVQPMEFAKIAIALCVARFMSEYSFSLEKFSSLARVAAVILLPMVIVVLQNDTGSGIVLGSFIFMLYREGLNNWLCIPIIFIAALFILSFVFTPATLLVTLVVLFCLSQAMIDGRKRVWAQAAAGVIFLSTAIWFVLSLCMGGNDKVSFYSCLLGCSLAGCARMLYHAFKNNIRSIYITVALFLVSISVLPTSNLLFNAMRDHQQKRITSFLGLVSDPKEDYNTNQSKIAIGSGGLFGKGYLEGSQVQYGFVPERHTDFIFCEIGEEFGFAGCIVTLAIMCLLILRIMKLGDSQEETFGRVYCYCVASMLLFHTLVNVGMTIGLMPVMGIPLPFISYGGSSLLAFTIMVFIAISLNASAPSSNATEGIRPR